MTESVPTRGSLRSRSEMLLADARHQVHVFQALPRLSPEAVKAMKHVARFINTSMRDNGIEAISGKAG